MLVRRSAAGPVQLEDGLLENLTIKHAGIITYNAGERA